MNFTWITARIKAKRALVDFWYWLMKPIAYFFTREKEKARYAKKEAKITKDQAITWIAEDLARYLVRQKAKYKHGGTMHLVVADFMSREDVSGCEHIGGFDFRILKRKKTSMAYYKFKKDVAFQEAVVNTIRSYKGFSVHEEPHVFTWEFVENYQTTYVIRYEG